MTAVAIDIRGVNLSYGATHVLKDIDLSIRPGELFAFLGPSGCGKTTLLRLIAGFAQAQTGQVLLDGQDVATLPPWKRDVGMVFQSYALWPHMTVAQNVAFGLEERRKPRAEVAAKVAQALELVGLSAYAQRRPAQLSGGQQQRVALARTIAIEPKVLLLDEPLSNLDARMRVSVRRDLRELQQRLGLTTIFVTHDQEEANTICDRIAVMETGVIRQVGTPMELYERPDNLFVAGFLGSANILEAEAGKRLVFRPQHATLAPIAGATMSGPVTNREFLGATVRYAVKIGAGEILVDVPFQSGAELRGVGETVGVALPAERMLYLPA
jgi:iron(III) transport system ATP-binding protein